MPRSSVALPPLCDGAAAQTRPVPAARGAGRKEER
jgi:hypothetical protein